MRIITFATNSPSDMSRYTVRQPQFSLRKVLRTIFLSLGILLQLLLLPATGSTLRARDYVAFSESSLQLYLSPRNLQFSTLPDGNQFRVASLETKQTENAYYSENFYDIVAESGEHSLTAIGLRGRVLGDDNIKTFTGMTNFQLDLLLDLDFEFFQSRFLWDVGFMWKPISNLLVGPAAGLSCSYFGSTMKFSSEADYSSDIGEKDQLYLIRDQRTGKVYLPTLGPYNFGGYWGGYLEFTGLPFVELSGALLLRLFDIPLLTNEELNQTLAGGKEVASVGGARKLELFMLDVRATLHLSRLNIEFGLPILVGYRVMKYPSLGLKEEGLYFGVAFFR